MSDCHKETREERRVDEVGDNGGKQSETGEVSRREFLKLASAFAVGLGLGDALPRLLYLGGGMVAIPASGGYLLVDTKKCAGCVSCMLACSLVHEGKENLSLSRIQVLQNPFGRYPEDVSQEQCRQCSYPACVEACPHKPSRVVWNFEQ
ncbi:MAG: twin-arginine translocation signal domain-containing protein, partial [Bacillota bacterium]|nr:twin-arginine translocation signal domain-containing protein [Bacillota bacterium]